MATMRKFLTLLVAGSMLFAGCSQDVLIDDSVGGYKTGSQKIEFGLSLAESMTRSSRGVGNSFVAGDAFVVEGFQNFAQGTDRIFDHEVVTFNGTEWLYGDVKYFVSGSTYDYYAVFPAGQAFVFDEAIHTYSIADFTVASDPEDQVDLMIAERKSGYEFNVVELVFEHILSNVNFYFKAADDLFLKGVVGFEIVSFDVDGIVGKGSYNQTGWSENRSVGSWTPDQAVLYDLPEVSGIESRGAKTSVATDLLMIPQTVSKDVVVNIVYRLMYSDGTSTRFEASARLAGLHGKKNGRYDTVIDSWQPKNRYNYVFAIHPGKNDTGGTTSQPNGTITTDSDDTERVADVDVVIVDTDGDGRPDEYWVDEDCDGTPDYQLVWADPDGDGVENLFPDRDGDGNPDGTDTDGDGLPDDLWVDADGDGKAETEIERIPGMGEIDPNIPISPSKPVIDYDGGQNGYGNPDAYIVVDGDGNYWIDTDRDGKGDIPILWKDIDGDGKLEGVADRNADGELTEEDSYDDDWRDYQGNVSELDVIMYDADGDGIAESELERDDMDSKLNPDVPILPSGPIIDYDGALVGYISPYAQLVEDENGNLWIDVDGDGIGDIAVLWKDIDADGMLEGIADRDGDGILTENDTYDGDGKDYKGNDNAYDVIMVDIDGDGIAEAELERSAQVVNPTIPQYSLVIEFSASVEEWTDFYDGNVNVFE